MSESAFMPSDTPEIPLVTQQITTTTAGRIFGFGRGLFAVTCMSPASEVRAALYLDGVPLVGSGAPLSGDGTTEQLGLFGMTADSVGPGDHLLTLEFDCVADASIDQTTAASALGAIVLGG